MAEFKRSKFDVKSETVSSEIHVTKFGSAQDLQIKEFQFSPLKEKERRATSFSKLKQSISPDVPVEKWVQPQKDRRFSLNPLLRDSLSIEEEERRAIEEKVAAQVQSLTQEVKEAAFQKGYEEGLKKGFDESFKKAQLEALEDLERLSHLVQEAEKAKTEIFQANERFLFEVIYRIAKMVLLRELSIDRDFLLRLAKELINRVGVRSNVILKLNPQDAESIYQLKEGLENTFKDLSNLSVETSVQVKKGGCQIETEWGAIDASIEVQLQGIYESLISPSGRNF